MNQFLFHSVDLQSLFNGEFKMRFFRVFMPKPTDEELILAVRTGDHKKIKNFFDTLTPEEKKQKTELLDDKGKSLFALALFYQHCDLAILLLEAGAKIDVKLGDQTGFDFARQVRNFKMYALLLLYGAPLSGKDTEICFGMEGIQIKRI